MQCTAHSSRTGEPCRKFAIKGATVCRTHGGAVGRIKRKAAERVESSKERVLEEYCHLSFVDIREAFDKDGNLLPIKSMPDRIAAAIGGIEYEDLWDKDSEGKRVKIGRTAKIKLIDKRGALDSMARHLGMFAEKNTGEMGGPIKFVLERIGEKKSA
jgi:phage terminase small subunit